MFVEEIQNALVLEPGDVRWNISLEGRLLTWHLKYAIGSFPLPNPVNPFKATIIQYEGVYYKVERVFSEALWLMNVAPDSPGLKDS